MFFTLLRLRDRTFIGSFLFPDSNISAKAARTTDINRGLCLCFIDVNKFTEFTNAFTSANVNLVDVLRRSVHDTAITDDNFAGIKFLARAPAAVFVSMSGTVADGALRDRGTEQPGELYSLALAIRLLREGVEHLKDISDLFLRQDRFISCINAGSYNHKLLCALPQQMDNVKPFLPHFRKRYHCRELP